MAVLDRQGIKMGPNTRTLEVCYASELEAAYLNVELDSPLLLFVDRVMLQAASHFSSPVRCTAPSD